MAADRLTALLSELTSELRRLEALGADARAPAEALLVELRRLGAGAAPSAGSHGLEALAVRFEADNPAAAATLRQLADQLGKAGI